jgi:hypothetical protein
MLTCAAIEGKWKLQNQDICINVYYLSFREAEACREGVLPEMLILVRGGEKCLKSAYSVQKPAHF